MLQPWWNVLECIGSIDFEGPRKLGLNFTEYQAVGMIIHEQ
jgi:hypothetical protein